MSPTSMKLSDVFKDILIPRELDDLKIMGVNADSENRKIEVVLLSGRIIHYKIIEDFKSIVARKYNMASVIIRVKYENLSFRDVAGEMYYENLKFYVDSMCPGAGALLQGCTWINDGNSITIKCVNGVSMLYANKCNELIEKLVFAQLGDKVNVQFDDCIEVEDFLRQTEEIENSYDKIQVTYYEKIKYEKEDFLDESAVIYGKVIEEKPVPLKRLNPQSDYAVVHGEVFDMDTYETKGGKIILTFYITDLTSSHMCKIFTGKKRYEDLKDKFKNGDYVKVSGNLEDDSYAHERVIMVKNINLDKKPVRKDNAENKRVELHMHTAMSSMDGMTSAKTLISTASKWGHKAVAITDHGNVQAYPEVMDASAKCGIKPIYGVECYLVSDDLQIVFNPKDNISIDDEFVVFDIETTGLDRTLDAITEIGAVKVKGGKVAEVFSEFVNPGRKIPQEVVELTGITDDMVRNAPPIQDVLKSFYDFIGDAVLVAHNADFDTSFIRNAAHNCDMEFDFCYVDTLELSRALVKDIKNHKLNTLAAHFAISLENHHRASDDATATAHIFVKLMEMLSEKGITDVSTLNSSLSGDVDFKGKNTFHAIILVKNQTGLLNLYHIISESHMEYFYKRPRVPKSLLEKYREGLILGSACEAGELYRAILDGKSRKEVLDIVNYYDYLEIQPIDNNMFLVRNGRVPSVEELMDINRLIIKLGKDNGKLTVATCDVHFLNPEDEVFRRILMAGQGFDDADDQAPLYFRTTEEMLEEFSYLGEELAYEVVVENTNKVADMIEDVLPIPEGTAPPIIEGSDEELREKTMSKAHKLYGDNIPQLILDRIDVELDSIINNGYSVMYIIAERLVKKSNSDGYLVGSRGSVGSSYVAYLSGITEVNSLPAHYLCPECQYIEFNKDPEYSCGFDLPEKMCPNCGTKLIGDGHDIPFETFLGFGGGKEPDIDLNFSGDYQPVAHKYTEELFGEGYVYRAGTIGTIADKTAYGFVKKYFEAKNEPVSNAEINRLVAGCTGVKRTTGQHPAGVMIVPRGRDIHEFTPIQYPADKKESGIITTHFDYHSISGKILKLDILGHDDPTVIKMLEDLTGIKAVDIPFADPETMSLFLNTSALGVTPEEIFSDVGTYAVPEFGTKFVRQMLVDTKPTTFAELVMISGLSHGTDVWLGNAQYLIQEGIAPLKKTICTRDDIMTYLISMGCDKKQSFKIMESVRKGKGLSEEWEAHMTEHGVPQWYIDSCKKIQYMFPKAHAAAYVTMAYRIAYFKVHYPKEFYATYFTVRADSFDAEKMIYGRDRVLSYMREYEAKGNDVTQKDKDVLTILEVCNEMYCRKIKFLPMSIYKSEATKFVVTEDGIIPPLNAIAGLGVNAANSIIEERNKRPFSNIDDLQERAKVSKTIVETMKSMGVLEGMRQSNQLNFFEMMG
ncbi:MAG: PolC-type DNA polymerase III [Ruminococcaceae bacterium]|nr:PolC-type DNA polymerase III [Oscillospiraceae bacterium]